MRIGRIMVYPAPNSVFQGLIDENQRRPDELAEFDGDDDVVDEEGDADLYESFLERGDEEEGEVFDIEAGQA